MATLSHSESRRLYSWWWDSHNTPKNSKWLQDNLTDMDGKVKSMIKLIEEDADSFARRAEMYYKKRPELMKLVEEFYRAYRALAERYNHATGELRNAHKTIAEAFPDQVPLELIEDHSPSKSSAQDDDFLENDFEGGMRKKKGLKQLPQMFEIDESFQKENQNLKNKVLLETERAGKAESEVEQLKRALKDMKAEKENVFLRYQQCLETLSELETELNNARNDSMGLGEKASRAEIEVHSLKEALIELEGEKIRAMIKHNECLDKMSRLEYIMTSRFQEAVTLRDEKEAVVHEYKQCLGKISDLENTIMHNENEAGLLKKQAEKAEKEVSELKSAFATLNKEKEAMAFQYNTCLETVSKLEKDLSNAKSEVTRLNHEILIGTVKLKTVEENRNLLEKSNHSLRVEADDLANKIAKKDRELFEKQKELDKLQTCLQDENVRRAQVESSLDSIQNLHSKSQDEQRALALELKEMVQMLKEMEVSKNGLEEVLKQVRDENCGLIQTNLSSNAAMGEMQNEIISLREMTERLENEVSHHMGINVTLQHEISGLKEEIKGLNTSYRALIEQVEASDLNPNCVGTSIKSLQDENSKLKQDCEQKSNEKVILSKKLDEIEGALKKKEKALQSFHGEKDEKAHLFSQLQAMTENMHDLLGKNAVLENSLSQAKVELEGLREKSKGLEEVCKLLKNERSYLITERDTLVSKLENVERRLESLEKRFTGLEEKYSNLEKVKEAMDCEVEKLMVSLREEKKERTSCEDLSQTRLTGLESQIHLLQEENRWKKKESQEELDKALKAQFEISILQKFMNDMEEKNCTLIIECQKHVEASKLADKLISELERENLEQQVESELLLDEIERLRLGIYQIFRVLESDPFGDDDNKVENERIFVHRILGNIEDMKCSIFKHEDEKDQLIVENSILETLLKQLEVKSLEIESEKTKLEEKSKIMAEKLVDVQMEKDELVEINEQLKSEVREGDQSASILEAELRVLCVKQGDLQKAYDALQEAYSHVNQENTYLLKKLFDLKEEKCELDQHNDDVLLEFLSSATQSMVLMCFGTEKITELKSLLEDLNRQHELSNNLEKEMSILKGKLELVQDENSVLKDSAISLEREMKRVCECNVEMKQEIMNVKESLNRTLVKLVDTEMKLAAAEKKNSSLCGTVAELKTDIHKSLEVRENLEKKISQISEKSSIQKKEIEGLNIVNRDLESELDSLRQEIEENTVKECEFELWNAEAAAFCFDLQVSSINEVLLKNKVKELTGVCQNLELKHGEKVSDVEEMKGKICFMESEISGLKSQLYAYAPVVASLKDDIALLEHNALLQRKHKAALSQEMEFLEVVSHSDSGNPQIPEEDESLLSLQNLQTRVKAVGKLMEETNKQPLLQKRSPKSQKVKPKSSEARNGMLMKDIPLDLVSDSKRRGIMRKRGSSNNNNVRGDNDMMLELWETAEEEINKDHTACESRRTSYKLRENDIVYDQFERLKSKSETPSTDSDVEKELGVDKLELSSRITTEPNRELGDRKILNRLFSDAKKLENLQTTVMNLRRKLDTNYNKKSRKSTNVDYITVQEQLQEAEDSVAHLVDLNVQLVKNIDECPKDEMGSPRMKETVKTWRIKVMEESRKGSERIENLQEGLLKIQQLLLQIEDDKKNKGRNKFLGSKTVILRDFIYNGRKNSGKRKKGPKCGCFKQSTSRNGSSS